MHMGYALPRLFSLGTQGLVWFGHVWRDAPHRFGEGNLLVLVSIFLHRSVTTPTTLPLGQVCHVFEFKTEDS